MPVLAVPLCSGLKPAYTSLIGESRIRAYGLATDATQNPVNAKTRLVRTTKCEYQVTGSRRIACLWMGDQYTRVGIPAQLRKGVKVAPKVVAVAGCRACNDQAQQAGSLSSVSRRCQRPEVPISLSPDHVDTSAGNAVAATGERPLPERVF